MLHCRKSRHVEPKPITDQPIPNEGVMRVRRTPNSTRASHSLVSVERISQDARHEHAPRASALAAALAVVAAECDVCHLHYFHKVRRFVRFFAFSRENHSSEPDRYPPARIAGRLLRRGFLLRRHDVP